MIEELDTKMQEGSEHLVLIAEADSCVKSLGKFEEMYRLMNHLKSKKVPAPPSKLISTYLFVKIAV